MKYEVSPWFSREMNKLFDNFLSSQPLNHSSTLNSIDSSSRHDFRVDTFNPSCEFEEKDQQYLFSIDLPGMKKEDIKIEFFSNQLVVSGERKSEKKKDHKEFHYTERSYGQFKRVFTIPEQINPDMIDATFDGGVLMISVPKSETKKSKTIAINSMNSKGMVSGHDQKLQNNQYEQSQSQSQSQSQGYTQPS